MVYYRRRPRNVRNRKGKRKMLKPRRRYGMSKRGPVRIFTETLAASDLLCNKDLGSSTTGQVWSARMSDVPQLKNYQGLYAQYKILKIKWRFIPEFNGFERNQALANLGAGGPSAAMPSIAYAISTDPKTCAVPPPSEIAVLTQNYSKIRSLGAKPFAVTVYHPLPDLTAGTQVSPGVVGVIGMDKQSWITLDDVTGTGSTLVQHYGLQTFVTCADSASYNTPVARVYCDITFALREAI